MSDPIDRTGALGADTPPAGLTNFNLMKADPVWAQLAAEVAKLQRVVIAQRTSYNALLAKLDSNHGAATDHVSTLAVSTTTYPDPTL